MAGTASQGEHRPARTKAPSDGAGRRSAGKNGAPKKNASATKVAKRLPVREGEERWTAGELEAVRSQLEGEIADLHREIVAAESQIAERMGDASEGAGDDQADTGAKAFEREHEMSLTYNARDLLAQNERAIGRIEEGTYGLCESCGLPIGKARLQAFPRATLCVTCKQRQERR